MLAYIVRRTLMAAFTIAVISFVSFVIIQLPGERDLADYLVMEAFQITYYPNVERLRQ